MKLCECGCGLEAPIGKSCIRSHHLRILNKKYNSDPGHQSKAGKIGGITSQSLRSEEDKKKLCGKAGKIAHKKHPELGKMNGQLLSRYIHEHPEHQSQSLKKLLEKNPHHQRKAWERRQLLYPNLSRDTWHKAMLKFHQDNPEWAIKRLKDQTDQFGYNKNKTFYYKGSRMRSSWEVDFAKLCDQHEIKWEYEPKWFDLPNGFGQKRYLPDFYLSEKDIWIQIKPRTFQTEIFQNFGKALKINHILLDKRDFNGFIKELIS